jgi:hypothetical protein
MKRFAEPRYLFAAYYMLGTEFFATTHQRKFPGKSALCERTRQQFCAGAQKTNATFAFIANLFVGYVSA